MLSQKEIQLIKKRLNREPNECELHVFNAMWSEHCSYKSSKYWLKQLPNKALHVPRGHRGHVICGPGENAGVVDIGDNDKIVFKIESHNHPSYIEPYQGAATGVGGIMRDIFTMGARPIANLNSLHFGRYWSASDVVKGIADYGNCIGVPTVSSKCHFYTCYRDNPLVNAMTVGYTNGKIFTSIPTKKGKVYYVGAKTGRDGIGGAVMASEKFEQDQNLRPTVQVGDPFYEKILLEASLELFETGAVIAAQDMGAAGLTSSTTEVALKGNYGITIDISKVPLREEGMEPWEILLSESQERMLFVLNYDFDQKSVFAIFDKWDLDCIEIGELTNHGKFLVYGNTGNKNKIYCNIPLEALDPPELKRKFEKPEPRDIWPADINLKMDWLWEQYDSEVMGNTIKGLEHDPAIVRIPNSRKAIAMTTTSNAALCLENPRQGAVEIVTECYTKLKSVDATPLAITNCLNFGNPENKGVMYEFVETIEGMKEVCNRLNFPVVSGNVSFYNETSGRNIAPTPVIGGIGLIEDYSCIVQ